MIIFPKIYNNLNISFFTYIISYHIISYNIYYVRKTMMYNDFKYSIVFVVGNMSIINLNI